MRMAVRLIRLACRTDSLDKGRGWRGTGGAENGGTGEWAIVNLVLT